VKFTGTQIFSVGDIVKESALIALPARGQMIGIVTYIDRQLFGPQTPKIKYEDMIGVMWLDTGEIEKIPASLLVLVRAANSEE
tara:strand:- start:1356 stop:1604 length:249 start_codon:yes stop_codon:yes gene_type:complete